MGKTYTDLVSDLETYCAQSSSQPGTGNFASEVGTFINNAELRIYRELDFLSTRGTSTSVACAAGMSSVSLGGMSVNGAPVYPVVIQALSYVLPSGVRVPCELVSNDFIDVFWPNASTMATPAFGLARFAQLDHQTLTLAPTPDATYPLEITGTWRPILMSATNTQTWLGDNLPDLLLAASMVEASAFMREFGAASDNPQMAMSWEKHYQDLKASAMEEEQRRKSQDPGWSPYSPAPLAVQPRTT